MAATRFVISGRVQGVFYRASTREQALELGLTGYAENLPDGRVEVIVIGAEAAFDALEQWLRRGPPAARVEKVIREAIDVSTVAMSRTGFDIR